MNIPSIIGDDTRPPVAIAFSLAAHGIPVLPLSPETKRPLTSHSFKDATTSHTTIEAWFSTWPTAMIGVATGAVSGLLVLDLDKKGENDGFQVLAELEREHGPLPPTFTMRTPSGGEHRYFEMPVDCDITIGAKDGFDHRGNGGYVVGPGSVRLDGRRYEVIDGSPVAKPPAWLVERLSKRCSGTARSKLTINGKVPEGGRNTALTREGGRLRRIGYEAPEIAAMLQGYNEHHCDPPLPASEVEKIAYSIARYEPAPELFTQFGVAKRLAKAFNGDYRYSDEKRWIRFDGARWRPAKPWELEEVAKPVVEHLIDEARALNNADAMDLAIKFQKETHVQAIIKLARSEPSIGIAAADFDLDPWLFNAQNGTVDLRSGELRAFDKADKISRITSVPYDPSAQCPTFMKFLSEIMGEKEQLVQFVQRLLGYGLLGANPEHRFAIFYGTGRNGKSTLLNIVSHVLGEYAVTARPDVFTVKRFDGIPNEVARLAVARLVTTSELPDGARLNAALIKQMCGGDPVPARFLYQEFFEFQPRFLPVMATNYEPIIDGSDMALMRRLLLVPFRVTIEPGKQIKDLPEQLKAEAPGILAWLVRGCREWQQRGDLEPPPDVQAATKKYASESDQLGMFLEERCQLSAQAQVAAQILYNAYHAWALDEGLNAQPAPAFKKALLRRGAAEFKKLSSHNVWKGLSLKERAA